jgi:acyl-CoA dehydrogenase family member 9
MTQVTASLIDRGLEDYMVETAMLKVFTTERLWDAVNDCFQIHGGSAYFDDSPLGRMLRDARINQIGEGSNEVLTSFIALVGMRGPGMEFKEIYDTMLKPWRPEGAKAAWGAGLKRLSAAVKVPEVPVRNDRLKSYAGQLARLVWRFNFAVDKALIAYREPVMEMQLVQERIANAAMELFAATCVLSRWDSELSVVGRNGRAATDHVAADLFVRRALRQTRQFLRGLGDNDDAALLATADTVLGKSGTPKQNGA